MRVKGSRNRSLIRCDGSQIQLRIRRLECQHCGSLHHELPLCVVPYKRHEANSIESVLENRPLLAIAVDESTIRRWKLWFHGLVAHWLGVLAMLWQSAQTVESTPLTGTALQRLRSYVGLSPNWLARIVHNLVNHNFWIQTRSAFSAGTK